MLGKALEMRDIETKGHTERTAQLTRLLAEHMGFKDMKGIMWGAYIHDIGKIAIPDRILLKPGKLTKEEFDVIKRHVIYGYDLIRNIEGLPETTKNVVLYHHERWDGTGYMRGLKGENIPLEARIFAVVDVFDALISERPYKKPWPIDKALKEIEKNAGTHFDPKVVKAFLEVIPQHLQIINV
jgi:putative nucleotidyltransferase with HDIG domain